MKKLHGFNLPITKPTTGHGFDSQQFNTRAKTMRTDATINRQQSDFLNNASTIGYGKYKAQFGDIVIFTESGRNVIGRVIGKIEHAPRLDTDGDCRGFLVVAALGSNLTHVMERWVNPDDVTECFSPDPCNFGQRDIVQFLSFFFGQDFKRQSIETLRSWVNYGQPDFAKFVAATVPEPHYSKPVKA